jgi:hypothetical protein
MSDNAEHGAAGVGALSPAAGRARRQRRPTGEPPPLPHPVTISARDVAGSSGGGPRRCVRGRSAHAVAPG